MPPMPQGPTLGEAAIALLKDTSERRFRIDIETDSTIEVDQAQEKADRTEFITAVSSFVQSWAPVLQMAPQLGPLAGELRAKGGAVRAAGGHGRSPSGAIPSRPNAAPPSRASA